MSASGVRRPRRPGPGDRVAVAPAVLAALAVLVAGGCGTGAPAAGPSVGATGAAVSLDADVPRCVAPPSPTSTPAPDDPAAGPPVHVTIPALGVSANVVPVRVVEDQLIPPADPHLLGWWSQGAVPGAGTGTAILTGHTVSTGGGVLDNLKKLQVGDRVTVRTRSGVVRYRVVEVTYYSKAELARLSGKLFSQSTAGRLVLSTCSNFDGRKYRGNTLAFADPTRGRSAE